MLSLSHTHTQTHTHTHKHTHRYTHRHTHTDTHTDIHTDTHTDIHTDTHTDTDTQIHRIRFCCYLFKTFQAKLIRVLYFAIEWEDNVFKQKAYNCS